MFKNFVAHDRACELYLLCENLEMPTHFKNQLLRASSSVALNIAEGAGRFSPNDQRRFYRIAYGSLQEVKTILRLTRKDKAYQLAEKTGGLIYGLCKKKSGH